MVKVSKRFVDEPLWPEFEALDRDLRVYLASVTERVIREGLHGDTARRTSGMNRRRCPGR